MPITSKGSVEIKLPAAPGGEHYQGFKIQPVEYAEANNLSFDQGNVVKYVTRFPFKNGLADLMKARFYINRLIALEEARAAQEKAEKQARSLEEINKGLALELESFKFSPEMIRDKGYIQYTVNSTGDIIDHTKRNI